MSGAKKQSEQHLIDRAGQDLLRSKLPKHWMLREYRPDYGLDFALETFRSAEGQGARKTYETLGEHIFIQLKTVEAASAAPLLLYARGNVEKGPEQLQKSEPVASIETYRFSLETSEIVTVERMGIAVPVLLVIADLAAERCAFVCLNDYIDKILIPKHNDYRSKDSRTIHVPARNEVGADAGLLALRWYARRAKLIAAFQRFVYQLAELEYARSDEEIEKLARYFSRRVAAYDFWEETEMWPPIRSCGEKVCRFNQTGEIERRDAGEGTLISRRMDILELWRQLALLPRMYEDFCREWFLPTALGELASAPPSEEEGEPAG